MHLILFHLETTFIFRFFLLVFNIFQAVLLSFVSITRVFSHQKIRGKESPFLTELNFADVAFLVFSV